LTIVASALAALSLSLGAVGAQAAPTLSAVNLCVKKTNPGRGTIRLVSAKALCRKSERGVLLVASPGQDGVILQAEPGAAGKPGEKGAVGDQGPVGEKGPTGDKGPQGATGDKGPVGDKGPQGATGDKGPEGDKGPTGDKGPQGLEGLQGPIGLQGLTGDKGPQGPEGDKGPTGDKGPQGHEGDKGPTGDKGPQGPEGDKGPTGDKGPEGAPGPVGPSVSREIRGGGGSSLVEDGMGSRFFGPSIDIFTGTETAIQEVLPAGGTVSDLRVYLTGVPGPGNKYTFTVRRDPAGNTAPTSTEISCSMSGNGVGSASCESSASQKFEAGDAISILATESGSPTSRTIFFRLDFQP